MGVALFLGKLKGIRKQVAVPFKLRAVLLLFLYSQNRWYMEKSVVDSAGYQNTGARGLTNYSLVLLNKAPVTGAANCLDGSPPGYYWKSGWSSGISSWIIYLEGGGWCHNLQNCLERSYTGLGSSKKWPTLYPLEGILSNSSQYNPDFCNWNIVYVKYCDGGAFSGYVKGSVKFKGRKLFFRGERIYRAVVTDLLKSRRLNTSTRVLLTGTSAGGQAALIKCQHFSDWMPKSSNVKCMADAGFFLDAPDISGQFPLRKRFQSVVSLHSAQLNKKCTRRFSQQDSWKCFFPENNILYTSAPLFILNSFYDIWQVKKSFFPPSADPQGIWTSCINNPGKYCTVKQLKRLSVYRDVFLKAVAPVLNSTSGGTFLDSCFAHGQAISSKTWYNIAGPLVKIVSNPKSLGQTIAKAVASWYFGKGSTKLVDCKISCNPTCP